MAKNQEIEFSTTAGSNTDIGGLGIDEGMPPSRVNDAMRYLMKVRADAITRHVVKTVGSYTAVKTDHNQFWRCTGAVTLSLTAAATLTDGWCLYVRANGGTVTIDPSGTELIDGLTTLPIYDGATAQILCTGTEFFSVDQGFVGGGVAPGTVMDFAGSTAPGGWLFCYGQSLLRTTYPALFAAIGTVYGAEDGTHFSVPDLRGRVVAGRDDMGGPIAYRLYNYMNGTVLGGASGEEGHYLSWGEMVAHTHTQQGTFATGGQWADHSHTYNRPQSVADNDRGSGASTWSIDTISTPNTSGSSNDHGHYVTIYGETAAAGGSGSHNNLQPVLILNKIICTGGVA